MKRIILVLLALAGCFSLGFAQNLLPEPQSVEWRKGILKLDKFCWAASEAELGLGAATLLKTVVPQTAGEDDATAYLFTSKLEGVESDEAYKLVVEGDRITLSANAPIGFIRAAQTLQQLVEDGGVKCCTIEDAPAYQWRGVMLDVSRHFLPIDFLKKHVDVLSSYKINRMHLHLTDAAGWRMEIKRYPRLTSFAAWRPSEEWKPWWNGKRDYVEEGTPGAAGGYYTQDELRDLVKYAQERGIEIIPEIEMPAHSEEVLTAYPELSCTHEPYKQADFCAGSVATYDFLENVLKEVMDVFPTKYIHVGGDEAGKASWKTCPLCQKKMQEEGLKTVDDLQAYLIRHFGNFLKQYDRELIGWDEVIDETLTDNSTIMIWRGFEAAGQAARMGHDVILSPGSHCYFDFYQDAPPTQPEAIGGYTTLETVYNFNPVEGMTDAEKAHVLGVQGNVWAEYIVTPEHREYMMYPRMLAIAEIGWNGTEVKDYKDFHSRALVEVDKLRAAGVNSFDLRNEVGERKEHLKPVKHKALGCKVKYNLPYFEGYAGVGDGTLTDGIRGGWANNSDSWQGFIRGKRFDVVIDLGKSTSFSKVITSFMQACGPEIFYPANYIVSVSDDGENFKELCHQEFEVIKTVNPDIKKFEWKGKAKGRYVRVQAKSGQFGGWIFADEVEVY